VSLQIVFLPDSELILPGSSGSQAALLKLEKLASELITTGLAVTDPPEVVVFATPHSGFGRPLPGLHIAEQLLRSAGFAGDIASATAQQSSAATVFQRPQLWLVMGTGAATHGEIAPLPHNPQGADLDAQLEQILDSGQWERFATLDEQQALDLGATTVSAGAMMAAALKSAGLVVEPHICHTERQFGVTYFAAYWSANPKTRA